MTISVEDLLPEPLLDTFRERAVVHDRENTFPEDDLADLRERGYLRLLVPTELGGLGGSLLEATRIQRRLAQAAPATALSMNMHLVVTGAALHAHRLGVAEVRTILEDAAAGTLFGFGISEPGNDAMLFDSSTRAEQQEDGGYRLTGTKIFTSLAPVWDRLVVHGRLAEAPETDPRLVFGTIARTADCVLTPTTARPKPGPFVMGISGAFELLIASVYTGIAERAVAAGTGIAATRRSVTKGIVHADDPDIRRRLADAAIGLDGAV